MSTGFKSMSESYEAMLSIVSTASQVPRERVFFANEGRPPPEPTNELMASYTPIPVRAYGFPTNRRELVAPIEPTDLEDWQDIAETQVTALEVLLSVNFMNEGSRDAAARMLNANFRPAVRGLLRQNNIGWRHAGNIRRMGADLQGGYQSRYHVDVHLFVPYAVTDEVLRAASIKVTIEGEHGESLGTVNGSES